MNSMPEGDTKTLILDVAEQEFASAGFGISLRHIIARAEVNLAAVHYHFGSKEALIAAVFERRIGPLSKERLELLGKIEGAAGTKPLPLEEVLEALVGPALRMTADSEKGGRVFVRLFGRTIAEPSEQLQGMLNAQFGVTTKRFFGALQRALPQLPLAILCWRFQFAVGAMGYIMADPQNVKLLTGGMCDPGDTETVISELVRFLASGLRAECGTGTVALKKRMPAARCKTKASAVAKGGRK